jgi:glucose/arabinose dehydrogenase
MTGMPHFARALLALGVLSACTAAAQDRVPEAALPARLKVVAEGLSLPVAVTFAPGDPVRDRVYVVEKTGRVRALVSGKVTGPPLLDFSARVSSHTEQGLLGLAFHPRYAENGRLFVDFTDRKGDTRIVELQVPKGAAEVSPASEHEWLKVDQPYANHNGGDLVFGPDGKLYIGLGDGGSHGDPHGNGQNPTALLGKMLRLDVDGPKGGSPEILMRGLRNPWRYAFDLKTGDLYIADVGQDAWEEIDVVPAQSALVGGQNFGWNRMEGLHCFTPARRCDERGLYRPVVEYSHRVGCSITGGVVYRGQAIPALDGVYLYADYCTALLRGFRYEAGRVTAHVDYRSALDPEHRLSQVSSFGVDAAGEVYLLSLDGTVFELVPR